MFVFKLVTLLIITLDYAYSSDYFVKCCQRGYSLNNLMKCEVTPNANNSSLEIYYGIIDNTSTCFVSNNSGFSNTTLDKQTHLDTPCADLDPNGTLIFQNCSFIHRYDHQCKSLLTPIKFWGASIVVWASFIYIFPYSIVVILYCVMSDLRRKAFDKVVMCFCLSQASTAVVLGTFGYFVLCHIQIIPAISYSLVGLTLMFLTISSVFWMMVMCFDVTLTITRFRWAPASTTADQNRKFRVYAFWVYGGSLIPTIFASFLELMPFIPQNCPMKPNFIQFDDTNLAVIGYVTLIPAIVFIINNVLFIYTSWRMFQIQKSTSMATGNRAKKKYITYLKLYFLMDAPWITGALAAIYPDLWILKFLRMTHPILLLMAILPRRIILRCFKCDKNENLQKNTQKVINDTHLESSSKKENSMDNK